MRAVGSRQKAVGRKRRGGALLAVLWLSAALSAIAFSLAVTVRGELERAGGAVESVQAYYLAEGAIERFMTQLGGAQIGDAARFRPGQRQQRVQFPAGTVDLEITGESGKLNVTLAPPEVLSRLFVLLGVDEERARQVAAGIVARRSAAQTNLSAGSSFSTQLPSFLHLEDLLMIGGMTPEIFYGRWERNREGRLQEREGLSRHLTVFDGGVLNVNYASATVLRAAGVPEGPLMAILQARETRLIEDVAPFGAPALPGVVLGSGGAGAYTVRATAQLKDRAVRRSVTALVRLARSRGEPPVSIVRWYPAN